MDMVSKIYRAGKITAVIIIINFLFFTSGAVTAFAQCPVKTDFKDEMLPYDVIYQWGILWKRAAEASLSLEVSPLNYKSVLTARTLSFADAIFPVRDTLISVMKRQDMAPLYYAKIANEDGTYRKDEVKYIYNAGNCIGDITLYRPKRNAVEHYTAVVENCAYDMLSVFYLIRTIDFAGFKMNQVIETKIFSGKSVEHLKIEYLGRTILKQNKKEYNAYKIAFRFSDESGKKVSDNIWAWISEDAGRIPLRVEGKLPIGTMRAEYKGR
ncbi:MAG: DUF3108 domain-containing protein [Barnesiella sp.]